MVGPLAEAAVKEDNKEEAKEGVEGGGEGVEGGEEGSKEGGWEEEEGGEVGRWAAAVTLIEGLLSRKIPLSCG
jgi:hypothetical protein